jgi:hypothetical protein
MTARSTLAYAPDFHVSNCAAAEHRLTGRFERVNRLVAAMAPERIGPIG